MSSCESTYLHLKRWWQRTTVTSTFIIECPVKDLISVTKMKLNIICHFLHILHIETTITFMHWAINPFLVGQVDSPAFTCHHLMIMRCMLICYNFAGVDESGEEVSLADISIENIPTTSTMESPARSCPPQKIHTPEVILTPGKNTSL